MIIGPPIPGPRAGRPRLRLGARSAVALGLVAAALASAAIARAKMLPSDVVLPGVTIDGERPPRGADVARVRALVAARADALLERRVTLLLPGEAAPVLDATLRDLGVRVDVDATVAVATRYGKSGDVLTRVEEARRARAGGVDVPLLTSIDPSFALPKLEQLKETADTTPVSARLDLDKHVTIPEKAGRYLDVDATLARIDAAAKRPPKDAQAIAVDAPVATFAPRISSKYLEGLDVSTVVSEYDTFFSRGGEQKRRGKNIDNAVQKLDGLVLPSAEVVSFNAVVGERSEANGFYKSWEIFKGEMKEGMGGGTCQVASTLHAAAFFAGLDVLERLPHSRPSAYIPMGLDSTVVYPAVDLKLRNPHPFPVVVHAKTDGGKLHVELLGKMRPVEVSFGREVTEAIPYKRKVVEDPALGGNKVLVKQHGIKGYRVKRSRLLVYPDGTRKKESTTDYYPPTTEIYEVPVGFDASLLPKLPSEDGAEAAEASAAAPPACADCTDPGDAVQFVDAPGAHAPTHAQKDPTKSLWLRR